MSARIRIGDIFHWLTFAPERRDAELQDTLDVDDRWT